MALDYWRPYFAYGSNMDVAQMRRRCPTAQLLGAATLRGHRFLVNRQGWATIVPQPEASVHGLLWRVTPADERALDRYEGVDEGLYVRATLEVETAYGQRVPALVYLAADAEPGLARPRYLRLIVAAAEAARLPGGYVAELRRWLR